jgi:hypothetical protein
MRHLYGRMPGDRNVVAITIDEPGGLLSSDYAKLVSGGHAAGAPEWLPPQRPTIIVAQSIRGDPLGQMYARHQIDPVRYFAGRGYQELHDIAQVGRMGSSDPTRSPGEGGRFPELITDRQREAARKLRYVDGSIIRYLGTIGLFIARYVLVDRRTLREAGERLQADKKTRAYLFTGSLTMIAVKLGLATASLTSEDAAFKAKLDGKKTSPRNGKT